jgi:uncharacterized protein YcaQ
MELLHLKGDLMVTERRRFQKIYDLTERVLPEGTDTSLPTEAELGRFMVNRALSAYGVATEKEIREHLQVAGKEVVSRALADLVDAGEVIPVAILGDEQTRYYALPGAVEEAARFGPVPWRVTLLSPFDNFIIQRERISRLFGFDYALECYMAATKRVFGYFVLPILWGERFVGRLDPKAERKAKTLLIRNLVFEEHFQEYEAFLPVFSEELVAFARFNNCDKVVFEKMTPAKVKEPLEGLLKRSDSWG